MRSLALAAALLALACAAPAAAQADFGLQGLDLSFAGPEGEPAMQAGSHPYDFSTDFGVKTTESEGIVVPDEEARDILAQLPPGFVANPTAVPTCAAADFVPSGAFESQCPDATAIGTFELVFGFGEPTEFTAPVYNLDPPPGVVARFGFDAIGVPVVIDGGLNPHPPYNAYANSIGISQAAFFYSGSLHLWGDPADPSHDSERGACAAAIDESLSCPANVPERPFTLLPRSCTGPLAMQLKARSWQRPDRWLDYLLQTHDNSVPPQPLGTVGCSKLPFSPRIDSKLSTRAASSASGLSFDLDLDNPGIANPAGVASADVKRVEVAFPEGVRINPSQAEGLEVCGEEQVERETASSPPGAGCPEASKIGTVEVETPLLEDKLLKGSLYVAKPYENPFGTLIALYVVIKSPALGISVVQPLKVEPDPRTGQLVSIAEDVPQLPFSHFRLHFREGGRAPLISPPTCGTYDGHDSAHEPVRATLYPWSGGAPATVSSSFEIISGPNNSPCPSGPAPFHPGFEAGTVNNAAGAYSPFDMRLTRQDGEQDMGKFSFVLPPGVVPKLAGIPYCSDAQIAGARGRQGEHGGQEEIDSPSCPVASQIGTTLGGAGVGSQLTYVPGKLYLAGPYNGDPISAVAIVPAVAGPFDAGTIVVREALRLNPVTHVGEVDGAASDPIPHILKGIPLNVREVRVSADKPEFTLNPTSCEPFEAQSTIWGDGTALEPLPEHPVDLASRFQAADCAALGFKPKLGLKLRGGTKRGRFPALHAVYTPRGQGDANLSRLALTFPKSEFIEQGHFRTICTRVQFAAGAGFGAECPKGSVYGHIKVWTPLLDEPLQGPVYLRSSDHNLPDAVFALHGLVDIELATRIDSVHGRLRAIVADSPDAPVSRAIVNMQGGQKGLFVNSTNLCAGKHRARVNAGGQNGRRDVTKPVMRAVKCKKHRAKKHRRHHRRARVAKRSAVR